ncbi:uncharacterized protein LOC113233932 [Hyposmocoma kahamanoa]|uniref:uncharacterized protein LOC113233932 n=1 Tax=Hyposmocoma kahamanoa TaxID=1477025 RepID=UPI000E6D97FE|nr:uncharacterized protein LOC113233932 [Hyposmocoma kahamanoa]
MSTIYMISNFSMVNDLSLANVSYRRQNDKRNRIHSPQLNAFDHLHLTPFPNLYGEQNLSDVIPAHLSKRLHALPRLTMHLKDTDNNLKCKENPKFLDLVFADKLLPYFAVGVGGGILLSILLAGFLFRMFRASDPSTICPEENRRTPRMRCYSMMMLIFTLTCIFLCICGFFSVNLQVNRVYHLIETSDGFLNNINETFDKYSKDTLSRYRKPSFSYHERRLVREIDNITKAMENNFENKYRAFIKKVQQVTKESEPGLRDLIESMWNADIIITALQVVLWLSLLIVPSLLLLTVKNISTRCLRGVIILFKLPTFLAILVAWALLGVFFVMAVTVSDLCFTNDTLNGITNITNTILSETTKKAVELFQHCDSIGNINTNYRWKNEWNTLSNAIVNAYNIITIFQKTNNYYWGYNKTFIGIRRKIGDCKYLMEQFNRTWQDYNYTILKYCKETTRDYSENLHDAIQTRCIRNE